MTTTKNTRADRIAADQAMVNGFQKVLAQLAAIPLGGKTMTPTDIEKVFQDRVAAGQAVITAEAALRAAVKADHDLRTGTLAVTQAIRRIVLGMFQETPDTLAIFGLKPPKKGKAKVTTKAAAVAKNKATRAARGTVGKKQKLAIKGAVATGNGTQTAPATPAPAAKPTA